ncbi:DUF433 domain-containing protein [Chitinophaga sp. Hz27]|uniref:DUF433 domain-containing protein n=1 Tax=Chitinophaga sp. Hz27 TaxID=3347169 RepID=UPI0035E1A70C
MNFVERNANRGFGQPVIIGRRLTVLSVVASACGRDNVADFLEEFDLSMEELRSAVSYCKNTECKIVESSLDQNCEGCILRSISEGWKSVKDDFTESGGISISKDGMTFFLGSLDELEDSEFGVMGWQWAETVEKKWFS